MKCRKTVLLYAALLPACASQSPTAQPEPPIQVVGSARLGAPAEAHMGIGITWLHPDGTAPSGLHRFTLTNSKSEAVYVLGLHDARNPVTILQVAKAGSWVAAPKTGYRCGDGLAWFEVQPGHSIEFREFIFRESNPKMLPMRLGVYLRRAGDSLEWLIPGEEDETAWTAAFAPHELGAIDASELNLARQPRAR